MRKVFVLLLCIVSLASLGQPIVSRAGSANTVSDARLQAAVNFFLPRYADTSFAASSLGVDSTGALIYTYVPNAIWVRKANPKKWVRITDANTNPYSAGYGLNLISNVFSVDSTVIATRGRLYKVVDSLIAARTPGLPSVLNVDNDADGKSIYNVGSLFTLDTLKTSGPFQLGYGVYTTSFPRTLTANRTMVVPDQSDTLAGRTWTRNYVTSITPTAPGLGSVLAVSNDGGGADITNVGQVIANTNLYAPVLNSNAGVGYGVNISDLSISLITPGGGGVDDRQLRFLDDHYGGGVQKRVWLQVNKAPDGDTYIPFSVNGQFADENGNIIVSTGGVDTTTISTRDYAQKVGDSTYGRVAASFLTSATAATTYVPKTTTVTSGTLLSGGGALSGNITVGLDTTGAATRDYAKKVGDSTYARVTSLGYVTQAGARTAFSLTTTGTSGPSTLNTITGVINIPQYSGGGGTVDTTTIATRDYAKKVGDSTYGRVSDNFFPLVGGSITGTGGAGFVGLIPQSSAPSTPASGIRLYGSSTGAFTWKGTNGFQRTFSGSGITADRTYTLPDATGTLALTSDLTSYLTTAAATTTYEPIFNQSTGRRFFTDFDATTGEFALVASGTGTNAVSSVNSTANHPGRVRITTGTTSTGRMSLQSASLNNYMLGGGATVFEGEVLISNLSDGTDRYQLIVGLASTSTSVNQTDGVYFLYDEGGVSTGSAASANWQTVTVASSSRTFNTTSTAVSASGWIKLRIEVNAAASSVQFYINGVAAGSPVTTNIPTSGVVGWATYVQKSLGATARNVDLDYILLTQAFTTPR